MAHASPVPAHTWLGSEGATASAPIACALCLSQKGTKVLPWSPGFSTAPPAAAAGRLRGAERRDQHRDERENDGRGERSERAQNARHASVKAGDHGRFHRMGNGLEKIGTRRRHATLSERKVTPYAAACARAEQEAGLLRPHDAIRAWPAPA